MGGWCSVERSRFYQHETDASWIMDCRSSPQSWNMDCIVIDVPSEFDGLGCRSIQILDTDVRSPR